MNPRNQVEIKIHKNDYLTISFIGDINFAGRWYGTPETLREKLRSFPHKSERDKVLDEMLAALQNEGMAAWDERGYRRFIQSFRQVGE